MFVCDTSIARFAGCIFHHGGYRSTVPLITRWYRGCRSVSLIVGAGIGGLLAQPAVNFPDQFDGSGVFGKYPYLLPNLVGACAAVLLLVTVLIYIPESRYFEEQRATTNSTSSAEEARAVAEKNSAEDEMAVAEKNTVFKATIALSKGARSRRYQEMEDSNEGEEPSDTTAASLNMESRDLESHEADGIESQSANTTNEHCGDDDQGITDEVEFGSMEEPSVLAMPNVKMILFIACIQQALVVGFNEAFPLWALSTLDVGGLAWGTVKIGQVFLATGVFVAVLQLVVYPRAIKLVSIETWQRTGCLLSIPAFIIVPYCRYLSWNDSSLFYFSAASMSLVYGFMSMVMLALTIASTTMVRASMRGKMAGLFNMVGSLGRAIGPIGFAITFAWSISPSAYDWVGHQFTFFLAALVMVLVTIIAWGSITEEKAKTPA